MEKVITISHWYNEELLAPLFLNHYKYCDEVRILLETDTNDRTREIISGFPNVVIKDVHCDGMDNAQVLANLNRETQKIEEGWVYVVDADEFIFPETHEDPQVFLKRQTTDVIYCKFFHVYRHHTEPDVDYTRDPIPQRIHALDGGTEHKNWFIKPSISRASAKVLRKIGKHEFQGEHTVSRERYIGAHWKQADYEICVRRRLSNKERHSEHDHKKGWGNHDFNITEERLRNQLEANSNLPILKYFMENI